MTVMFRLFLYPLIGFLFGFLSTVIVLYKNGNTGSLYISLAIGLVCGVGGYFLSVRLNKKHYVEENPEYDQQIVRKMFARMGYIVAFLSTLNLVMLVLKWVASTTAIADAYLLLLVPLAINLVRIFCGVQMVRLYPKIKAYYWVLLFMTSITAVLSVYTAPPRVLSFFTIDVALLLALLDLGRRYKRIQS
ncbi:YneF family protein [Candidatus Uhrbacteria bacterium]|nr:YneF family protein [Candidatus Uhrbacteria bacterium]